MTFSIDGQSASIFRLDSFYNEPILESDILTPGDSGAPGPNTPSYPPRLTFPPGMFIRNPPCATCPNPGLDIEGKPSSFAFLELDALSYGKDPLDTPFPKSVQPHYVFSVDEFAVGLPGTDLRREGALGTQEASADTFITPPKPVLPVSNTPGSNYFFTDGNGEPNVNDMPGVGLIEPNPPSLGTGFGLDEGDNLDALDFDTSILDQQGPVYFSLDSAFDDPLEDGGLGVPNYGSAAANGYVGGDVIVGYPSAFPGGPHALYAAAGILGLDQNGDDTDDLDALKLHENGVEGYQPSEIPFDWLTGVTDMLLFSVRRNSDIIGTLDSIFGIPIEEGDVLTTPCPADGILPSGLVCAGGGAPGIFTAAEWLGLATVRSGNGQSWGVANPQWDGEDLWADDLDALDQKVPAPATLALLGMGIAAFGALRRRRFAR
jgi:hypothetical protein